MIYGDLLTEVNITNIFMIYNMPSKKHKNSFFIFLFFSGTDLINFQRTNKVSFLWLSLVGNENIGSRNHFPNPHFPQMEISYILKP